jgi:hypothetical protein
MFSGTDRLSRVYTARQPGRIFLRDVLGLDNFFLFLWGLGGKIYITPNLSFNLFLSTQFNGINYTHN